MATVLVTGATGFVGSHLVRELIRRGYPVRALARTTSDRSHLADLEIDWREGDITDEESVGRAVEGVDTIFHLAALFREAKFADSVYWQINLEGTRHVLDAARKAGVRRLVHCSTTGVHGNVENPPGNELTPYAPNDVYQESKAEAEKLVIEYGRSGKLDTVVVRPIMIWGPGDKRILKLFRGIARRRLPIIGDGKTLFHWVLVSDLVNGFILAAEKPGVSGEVFLVGGSEIVTIEDTYRAIASELGVSLLPLRLPVWPFKLAGAICESVFPAFGMEPPIFRRRADFFTKSRAYDISKARRVLGFAPAQSFRGEVAIIARWYRENGWL